jgi:AcrR family transcriptional regulator
MGSARPSSAQKERILEAALALYQSAGLDGFSMRKVAAALGSSAMGLYRHYENKDALIEALVQAALGQLYERETRYLERAGHEAPGQLRVVAQMAAYLDFALEEPHRFSLVFLAARRFDGPFLSDYKAGRAPSFERLRAAVADAMRDGALPPGDSVEVAVGLWAHAHGLIALYWSGRLGNGEQLFRGLFERSVKSLFRAPPE